jgi:hypothetical protein
MTFIQLISYLKDLGCEHVDIQYTAFGDHEEILGAERNRIKYPCLWIETPIGTVNGDTDSMMIDWTCAIVVLVNSKPENLDLHLQNLNTSLCIAMQIIARLRKDIIDNNIFRADISKTEIDPIWSTEGDNDQGFRVSFVISSKNEELCYKPEKWA